MLEVGSSLALITRAGGVEVGRIFRSLHMDDMDMRAALETEMDLYEAEGEFVD